MTEDASEAARRLRASWATHRARPFPAAAAKRAPFQEIALYESWLGPIVESALRGGGRLTPAHRAMLAARRAEGNQGVWAAAAGQPDHVRAYVARLLAIEDLLEELPAE